jgi:hypothetical protein
LEAKTRVRKTSDCTMGASADEQDAKHRDSWRDTFVRCLVKKETASHV